MDYLLSDMWKYAKNTLLGVMGYQAGFVLLVLVALLALIIPGRKMGDRIVVAALLAYLVFVFSSTVLLRDQTSTATVILTPFRSWRLGIFGGNRQMLLEDLENVALFVPVGLGLGYISRDSDFYTGLLSVTYVFIFSASIELLQYISAVGTCEFDDVFNNTLGAVLGFVIARWIGKHVAGPTLPNVPTGSGPGTGQGAESDSGNVYTYGGDDGFPRE